MLLASNISTIEESFAHFCFYNKNQNAFNPFTTEIYPQTFYHLVVSKI